MVDIRSDAGAIFPQSRIRVGFGRTASHGYGRSVRRLGMGAGSSEQFDGAMGER